MVALVVTVVVVGALLTVVPYERDVSYTCRRQPISVLRDPEPETGGRYFFDEGAACNRDARGRGRLALGLGVAGALATLALAAAPRLGMRPGRPIAPRPAAARPTDTTPRP